MEEINAWGAYESGTTQNARSLGRNSAAAIRRARQTAVAPSSRAHASTGNLQSLSSSQHRVDHTLFFGTDDVSTLKKKDDDLVSKDDDVEQEEVQKKELTTEQKELYELAREVFHVYFNDDDGSDNNIEISKYKTTKLKDSDVCFGCLKMLCRINGTMPSLPSYLATLQLPTPVVSLILFVEASFRGIAQVYFQNNPMSGLLILLGMFVQSTRVAVHGVIAIVVGNLAGLLMGFDKSFLSCGLFGYNSFLVGLAIATFYSTEKHGGYYLPVIIGVIIFAYFSSVLFVMLGKILSPYKTPPFTLPFNISTIIFLLALAEMNNIDMGPVRQPELPNYDKTEVAFLTARAFFAGSVRGVGQVFLANDITAGILVLVGIMVCSRISALAAFVGSVVGAGVAAAIGCDRDSIENGMYGFNPSLTLTAVTMFYVPSMGSMLIGIVAAILTVFIQLALSTSMSPTGLPFMTLPFCIAALAFIVIQGTTSNVISVPLSSMTTPEDHLKRVRKLSNGFELLYGAIHSKNYKGSHNRPSTLRNSLHLSGSQRMSSALDEYNESVHGERGRGFFTSISQRWKTRKEDSSEQGSRLDTVRKQVSFRMSMAIGNTSYGDEEKDSYARIFNYIDADMEHEITKQQFMQFLVHIGFSDQVGLDFALAAFQLMDLDNSGDIDVDEFIAFAKISKSMPEIRRHVVKFFDFVDVNGDRAVEIRELDDARSYLALPPLSEQDNESLLALCNDDEELEFDVIVNFVTIFKLKAIVKEYQRNREQGHSLDRSLHSSLK